MASRLPGLHAMVAAVAIATGLAGCSSSLDTSILNQPGELLGAPAAAVTGSIQAGVTALGKVELPKAPEPDPEPVGKSTELYTRIARGATRCWFGGEGHLRPTHIFNAVAEPDHKGGVSEIVIHEKTPQAPDPRGPRAFRVTIEPDGDTSKLSIENARFPLEEGQKMEREVRRWARGEDGCRPRSTPAGDATLAGAQVPEAKKPSAGGAGKSTRTARSVSDVPPREPAAVPSAKPSTAQPASPPG